MWDKIKAALEQIDLADWLSDYADTKSAGDHEIRLEECPMCGNDKYKLYVNPGKPAWNCKVCDWGRGTGNVIELMSKVSGKSEYAIRAELLAVAPLAPKSGDITAALEQAFGEESIEEEEYDFKEITPPGHLLSSQGVIAGRVHDYALSRGLTEADVTKLQLRVANTLLSPKGTEMAGPFLVFPVQIGGKTVSWQGRRNADRDPKYISADNIKHWMYPFCEQFFSLYKGTLFIVEGVFDALGMQRLGFPALCTFGTSVSNKQLNLMKELKPNKVCFAWDLGAHKEVIKTIERVSHVFPNTCVATTEGELAGRKLDAGEALRDEEAAEWVRKNVKEENMIDVRSAEFFQWQMTKL